MKNFLYLYLKHIPSDNAFQHNIMFIPNDTIKSAILRARHNLGNFVKKNKISYHEIPILESPESDIALEIHIDSYTFMQLYMSREFMDYAERLDAVDPSKAIWYDDQNQLFCTQKDSPFTGIPVRRLSTPLKGDLYQSHSHGQVYQHGSSVQP